ncbi:MoaA/NifB/PqqE family protein [Lysobacter dokdonensis DS-58]|uniref:MoaA/NifB/PqqE family protein n=1 Tax=Lysobacter dokdonensis DS-58 TaxID=1300345 RepID=A0A0A2WG58_9GAMM|nr:radical SAM protein [Lysobacter dokdonensis]KGQ18783.1 MoaA/NifB/PqqE family protein [Lysobacter dokdonensis DS-58]
MRRPISLALQAAAPPRALDARLEDLAVPLRSLDEPAVRAAFALDASDALLKTTLSLCPTCLSHVPAAVLQRGRQVWLHKRCPAHGPSAAVIENDIAFYRVSSKDRWGRIYGGAQRFDIPAFGGACCGPGESCGPVSPSADDAVGTDAPAHDFSDQQPNKTCTVLVEVTDACNLACRVCYSDSKGDRVLPLEVFKTHVAALVARKQRLDSVQLTGGEASLHPQFWELLEWLCAQPAVGKVYLPTNGLLFNRPGFAQRLKPLRERVLVLLQFDGRDTGANPVLRKAKPERQRETLIRTLDKLGIAMQLTMTLSHGVSEDDIAWVVQQGLRHRNVRLIAMQPAFFSGRYELGGEATQRLTLSDCVKGVVAGMGGKARTEDFMPIPCSHPNCGWVTLFARRFGIVRNIARNVDLDAVMNDVAYKTLLDKEQMRGIVGTKGSLGSRIAARVGRWLIRPKDVFGIAIKPFMDRFSYDQDRVSACCHHILDTHGNAVSFCEYNARLRHADSWSRFPVLP